MKGELGFMGLEGGFAIKHTEGLKMLISFPSPVTGGRVLPLTGRNNEEAVMISVLLQF